MFICKKFASKIVHPSLGPIEDGRLWIDQSSR